ncbi:MAG: hypothetical protein UR28_C0035G0003 [Candidatus Peregrinibacteria bacterium GW2011_GWF2_33_10]|nr:MAG: hypothetical protein UR28_C0035G0003 [Candidatus Peregrinibacteria bacterium GW2011_GWF2_33_10]OGJ46091.1 MAG: hypothetical protein A2263_00475 [Candidatus Peregrinibacteria bacterium RIFOXYA2_FULL_33_21]OGJ46904.1 MAG: hypothetical protein A2272_06840 [Candidatus Peregrinibacteria bacterium RIFOXYA12_FULL_33_12]OGJ51768.1 MAG: hypothetical protein A2307_05910 [Candidatus Peregrinibacteria bacterium RIFOXYB2_FULL_33_20]
MKKILNNLSKVISTKTLSEIAKKRLKRDLETIRERIQKNEYESSGIVFNTFDVPDKTQQFLSHLKTYSEIGNTWALILNSLPVHEYKNVLDLCPGFTPKIELALFYIKFKGEVTILDNEQESINRVTDFSKLIRPEFKITSYRHNLFTTSKKKFPFIIGNHIIDDLILFYFMGKNHLRLKDLYEKEHILIKTWERIYKNKKQNLQEISDKLTQIFINLVSNDGYLCLSQYRSYLEKMLNLDQAFLFTKKVCSKIENNLLKNGFTKIPINDMGHNCYFNSTDVIVLKK